MQGHTGRLNSVRLGPDNMALTVSDDYTARAWDLRTGKCKHVFKGALRPHSLEGTHGAVIVPASILRAVVTRPSYEQQQSAHIASQICKGLGLQSQCTHFWYMSEQIDQWLPQPQSCQYIHRVA